MTFPLDFDLLVIGVCTFIQKKKTKTKKNTKKKQKQKEKKQRKKKQNKKNKKKQKKNEKKKSAKICLCLISYSIGFCCWVHHWGFE